MKKATGSLAIFALLLSVLILGSCSLVEKQSPQECMDAFISDVNAGNWGNLKGYTYPLSIGYSLADSDFWTIAFAPATTWVVTDVSGSTATASGDGSVDYDFTLVEKTPDYYVISKIMYGSTPVFQ